MELLQLAPGDRVRLLAFADVIVFGVITNVRFQPTLRYEVRADNGAYIRDLAPETLSPVA
jgi:hypothetical protein